MELVLPVHNEHTWDTFTPGTKARLQQLICLVQVVNITAVDHPSTMFYSDVMKDTVNAFWS